MNIEENKSLKKYNTFNVESISKYFVSINSINDLKKIISNTIFKDNESYILGGGSNTLFTRDFDGLIIYNNLKGYKVIDDNDTYIDIEIMSGENWHDFVTWSVERNLWNIEKLSLIPGTVGASAVQNIGAYGSEAKDSIVLVNTLDIETGEEKCFDNSKCNFEYRNSIFKSKPNLFITSIVFRLNKKGDETKTSKEVSEEIIKIRKSKLPEIGEIGMAGSFFKNPVIDKTKFDSLIKKYPDIVYFEVSENKFKLSAGWILEKLGYKGLKKGNTGTYHKHSLVLVNHNNATGSEVWSFAEEIMKDIEEKFNIKLEPEVLII